MNEGPLDERPLSLVARRPCCASTLPSNSMTNFCLALGSVLMRSMCCCIFGAGPRLARGMQEQFQWRVVAAAALGGAAGEAANEGLNAPDWRQVQRATTALDMANNIARASVVGFAAGATTMLARGGALPGHASGDGCVWQCVGSRASR